MKYHKLVSNERNNDIDTEGSWAISYGDLVTLLLTFFILFFTINISADKRKALDDSLMAILSPGGKKQVDRIDQNIQDAKEEAQLLVKADLSKWGGKVIKVGEKIVVSFPGVSFFKSAKIDVTKEGIRELQYFARSFVPYAGQYLLGIHAYADNRKVQNKYRFKDNLELSALRSVAAMRTLQSSGIPLNRMRLGGQGELQAVVKDILATNGNLDGKHAFSRKVVLVIEPAALEENL